MRLLMTKISTFIWIKKYYIFIISILSITGLLSACNSDSDAQETQTETLAKKLERVTEIHGGAGPWAVVGFRMGRGALRALGFTAEVPHTSQERFELYVAHYAPLTFTAAGTLGPYVQFTSVADGLHAGTGASVGKGNLRICDTPGLPAPTQPDLVNAATLQMRSVIVSRKPNQPIRCVQTRVTLSFAQGYLNLPFEQLVAKGREAMELPDAALFTLEPLTQCPPNPPRECNF